MALPLRREPSLDLPIRSMLCALAWECSRRRAWLKAVEAEPKAIWILKPPASSCGRGIRLVTRATAGSVSKSKKCLVQVWMGLWGYYGRKRRPGATYRSQRSEA